MEYANAHQKAGGAYWDLRLTDGKARVAQNANTGGDWLMLRELRRQVNTEIRAAREMVDIATG